MKIAIMAVLVRTLPAYRPALALLVCTARLIHSTMAPSLIHQLSTHPRCPCTGALAGPRQSVMIFAVCLSLACYFNGTLVRDKPSLAFGFFMVRLFGQGGMSLVPKTVVPRWFVRRRGIAMGLLSIGWMVSQAVLPAVNSTLIDQHGYRTAWKFWAACVLVMVPVAGGLMIDDPLHVGLCPDGNGGANPTPSSPTQSRLLKAKFSDEGVHEVVDGLQTEPTVADTSLTPETALKQPQFYALAFAQLEGALVHTAVTFHAFSIVGHSVAPGFLAARSVVGLPTNLIAGWSVDHVGGRAVMIAGFGIQVVGLLLLTHAGDMEWVAVISGGLLGASSALVNIAMSTLIPSVFGVKHLGAINGLFSSVGVFGSAIGPWVFGVSADSAGTWQWSLWGSAIYAAGCVGVTATLKS